MAGRTHRITRVLSSIEGESQGGWRWLLLLGTWILLRNLLEGVLERPHQLGFDWREDVSFPMVFLHFPLFYLALFLGLCLWLHLLTRRPLVRVLRAVSLGYALLLVAPVLDAILSRGRGYDLKYLLGPGPFLWRFWNPLATLGEISPGQRIEILLACLLGGLYTIMIRREEGEQRPGSVAKNVGAFLLAGLGIYLLCAFLGAWPSLFAQMVSPARAGATAYPQVFQGTGLISSESRRLAVVMALPFLASLPCFLWRLDPARFPRLVRKLGWTRAVHYTGLVPAGVYLGWLVYYGGPKGRFLQPVDYAATLVLWAAMFAAFLASLAWNDLHDLDSDRINAPERPLVNGLLTVGEVTRLGGAFAVTSAFLALCVSYQAFLLVIACLLLSWAYSAPPLRLKRWPLLATGTLAVLSLLSVLAGFSLFAQEMTPRVFPAGVALLLLVGVTLGFTAKDLKDGPGDRAGGVITVATLFNERWARRTAALLVALSYLLAPVFLFLGWGLAALCAVFAAGSAWATLRLRRPDGALLVGLVLFIGAFLALLTADPHPLLKRVPIRFKNSHLFMQEIDDGIRELQRSEGQGGSGPRLLEAADSLLDRGRSEDWAVSDARDSVEHLEKVRRHDPHDPDLLPFIERLERAKAWLLEPRAAIAAARQLTETRPLDPEYWDLRLRTACRSGDAEEALAVCTEAIRLGIRPGDFFRNRAALRLASGAEAREIAEDLNQASLYGQRPALVTVLAGDLLLRAGHAMEARETYRRATLQDPESPEAWAALGEADHAAGNLPAARESFERARALSPRDPWTLNNLGVTLRDLGRLEEAEAAFQESHQRAPGLFEPIFNLGAIYERLGRPWDAQGWYEEARRIRPGFPPVEEAWARISKANSR